MTSIKQDAYSKRCNRNLSECKLFTTYPKTQNRKALVPIGRRTNQNFACQREALHLRTSLLYDSFDDGAVSDLYFMYAGLLVLVEAE